MQSLHEALSVDRSESTSNPDNISNKEKQDQMLMNATIEEEATQVT